jgi:hypothetical protein
MAVYKGREVTVLGKTNGEDTAPLYTIQEKSGQRADVPMNQLQFTKDEMKDLEKGAAWHLDGAKVIEDKDLADLRDKQDKAKIEKNQESVEDKPVKATTYVKPSEVKAK